MDSVLYLPRKLQYGVGAKKKTMKRRSMVLEVLPAIWKKLWMEKNGGSVVSRKSMHSSFFIL